LYGIVYTSCIMWRFLHQQNSKNTITLDDSLIVNENTWSCWQNDSIIVPYNETDALAALNTYVGDHFVNWYLINR